MNFQFNSQKNQALNKTKLQADDCINGTSVEICDGEDGCGYAKSSCICDYLKSRRNAGTDNNGISGGMSTTTYNLES